MRAVCERCDGAQPIDWCVGDLCVHCGEAVRHEVRCAWCAKWTPAATYCRECGAEVVREELYGAARMLKDAGVDRFTIPKQLATLDPAQIDNFTRIYQRQAIVVVRHVEQLSFVQRFLRQRHWAAALEDLLLAQLPWADDTAASASSVAVPLLDASAAECLETLTAIEAATPFTATRELAAIARLRADDWPAVPAVRAATASADAAVRDEAALALTSWRVRVGVWPLDIAADVIELLRASRFPAEAGVRLAALSRGAEVPPDALTSDDRETSIGAALLLGDVDRLEAALQGDVVERSAAGAALARLGVHGRLGGVLAGGPDLVRRHVLDALALAKVPAPDLADEMMAIVEATDDPALREAAVRAAAPSISPQDARRVVQLTVGESRAVQALLQRSSLAGDDLAAVLDELITLGSFSAGQFGVSTVVEAGRLPLTFVPARFGAASADVRRELLALAELQLAASADTALQDFLLTVVFGPTDGGELRTAAWWVLHRWYKRQGDHRGEGPLRLTIGSIDEHFGGLDTFLPALSGALRDRVALAEPTFADFLAGLLSSADAAFVAEVQQRAAVGADVVDALAANAGSARHNTSEAMWTLLSRIAAHPPWREHALTALLADDRSGNHHYDRAVRRLVLAEFGIPTDDEWSSLPLDFVSRRFPDVTPAGQVFLLDVAEHQLIHAPSGEPHADLLAFLATVAETNADPHVAQRAREIHHERGPRPALVFERPGTEIDFR